MLNGAMVRTVRHRLQLTQQELALTCGLYQQHISALERGIYTAVHTPTLAALAQALGVTMEALVTEAGSRAGGQGRRGR
jgi:transcriptional regulator with XRE-family HTH domain